MSTSRCMSLNVTATEKWYRSWYSCLLLYLFAAALASSNNINPVVLYRLVYFCETVEHDEVLSLLAHNGDGIRNIAVSERLDLVTNCLFFVSCIHLAVGTKLSSGMLRSHKYSCTLGSMKGRHPKLCQRPGCGLCHEPICASTLHNLDNSIHCCQHCSGPQRMNQNRCPSLLFARRFRGRCFQQR